MKYYPIIENMHAGFNDYFSIRLLNPVNRQTVYRRINDGSKQVNILYDNGRRKMASVWNWETGDRQFIFTKERINIGEFLLNKFKSIFKKNKAKTFYNTLATDSVTKICVTKKNEMYVPFSVFVKNCKGKKAAYKCMDTITLNENKKTFPAFETWAEHCGESGEIGEYLDKLERMVWDDRKALSPYKNYDVLSNNYIKTLNSTGNNSEKILKLQVRSAQNSVQ